MAYEIANAVIVSSGAIVLAVVTYWFTKKRERDAELRKERLEHYKEFVASLSGIIAGESTKEGQQRFSLACNKLNLVAPQVVIAALQDYQNGIKQSGTCKTLQQHDELLSKLMYEMRKDLRIAPADDINKILFRLWSSGVTPREQD